jgi:hypothetical protein
MSPSLRAVIFAVCAALWLSGVLWLSAHLLFPGRNEFGSLPNPWEPTLMRLHGLIAAVAMFLFGWVAASHVLVRWSAASNRASGLWLLGCALVLPLTGYALYYTSGPFHDASGVLHEWLGTAAIVVALAHWLGIRRRSPSCDPV